MLTAIINRGFPRNYPVTGLCNVPNTATAAVPNGEGKEVRLDSSRPDLPKSR